MSNKKDQDIEKIIIKYKDGQEDIINKGFVGNFFESDGKDTVTLEDEPNISFDLVNISGEELFIIFYSFLHLGEKLGFFDKALELYSDNE